MNTETKERRELLDALINSGIGSQTAVRLVDSFADSLLRPYQWRPIGEIHEDFGSCVLMRIDDPGDLEIGNNLCNDFYKGRWTHFAEVPKLSIEDAEELEAAIPVTEAK